MEKNNEFFKQLDQTETLFLENEKIAEVIKSVIMSRLLFLTKEGKIYSHLAEEYIRELNEYAVYCKDGKQEEWKELVREIVYVSGNGSDERVLFELESFERVGTIMKMQDEGASYEALHNYFFENACESGIDQILFGLKMLKFAKDGRKFIEEHYSDKLPCKRSLLNSKSDDVVR
jgi:hypothetical protein